MFELIILTFGFKTISCGKYVQEEIRNSTKILSKFFIIKLG